MYKRQDMPGVCHHAHLSPRAEKGKAGGIGGIVVDGNRRHADIANVKLGPVDDPGVFQGNFPHLGLHGLPGFGIGIDGQLSLIHI